MINKVSTVAGFMFLAALILLAVLNLDALAAQPGTEITVINTPANPVPTKDVDNPAKQPFQRLASVTQAGNPNGEVIATVPAGKRLVIETITSNAFITLPGIGALPLLLLTGNGLPVAHTIGLNLIGQTNVTSLYSATHAVRLYADPATDIKFICNALVFANRECTVTISGHFVDVP